MFMLNIHFHTKATVYHTSYDNAYRSDLKPSSAVMATYQISLRDFPHCGEVVDVQVVASSTSPRPRSHRCVIIWPPTFV
ncbi:hypothetical protein AAMO2058_000203300 [Amorphochlora amoebiformis]